MDHPPGISPRSAAGVGAITQRVRRVVTGHDCDGRAVVVMDGIAPNTKVREAGGFVHTLMWITDETPADISGRADRADRIIGVAPPPSGSILRIVDFPPVTGEIDRIDHAALIKAMGADHGGHDGRPPRHPFMHRTRSVDYAIVLDGAIDMLLDKAEVCLMAGDVVVQRGTNHAWVNRSDRTCRMAFVLIDAQEPAAWAISRRTGLKARFPGTIFAILAAS